ncbi:hypothetical protein HDV62DRAFT_405028 [Trichoderma sp. SZMC 28011]
MDPESEHAARVALAGNSTLNDLIPRWERSMILNPKDPLEQASTVQQTDYPKYEKMIQHWENFLNANPPPQVHLYWKTGLAEAKQRFTLGPKPTKELRQLVEIATRATEQDLLGIKWFSMASPKDSLLKYDMCVTIPRVLAQLMGMGPIGPPQDDEFLELDPESSELWEGYFAPKIRQQWPTSMSLIYASELIANFWDVDLEDINSILEMHLRAKVWYQRFEESLNTDHYAGWMKAWKEEFPEVADGFEEEDALRASKVKAELKAWKEAEKARMSVYKGEGEATNREETGQEVSALHAPPDVVSEEPLGGMEPSDADWEDVMDMD